MVFSSPRQTTLGSLGPELHAAQEMHTGFSALLSPYLHSLVLPQHLLKQEESKIRIHGGILVSCV